jgi:tetratricopeptide (TPR) repeat protein
MRQRRRRALAFLAAGILAAGPGTVLASKLEQGAAAAQEENWIKAAQLFEQATQRDRADALAWYNLGVARSKLRQWDLALYAYRESVRLQPDFEKAALGYALALEEAGAWEAAVPAYERAAVLHAGSPLAADARVRSLRLRKLLLEEEKGRNYLPPEALAGAPRWWAAVQAMGGGETNVGWASDAPTADFLGNLSLHTGSRWFLQPGWPMDIEYSGLGSFYSRYSALNDSQHFLSGTLSRPLASQWSGQIGFEYAHAFSSDGTLFSGPGLGLGVAAQNVGPDSVRAGVDFEKRQYRLGPLGDALMTRAAVEGVEWLTPSTRLGLGYEFLDHGANNRDYSYGQHAVRALLSQALGGTLVIRVGYGLHWRTYEKIDPTLGQPRKDTRGRLFLEGVRFLNRHMAAVVNAVRLDNRSNISFRRYKDLSLMAGVLFRFRSSTPM